MKEKIVEIKNLYKSFGKTTVLENINLEIYKGEIFGLLGPNGAGKTTLLRIISEGLPYEKGEIKVNTKKIGICTQENIFYDELSVKENLEYFGMIYGLNKKELKERIEYLLELLELKEYENCAAKKLSGGLKRRLNLAVSVIHDPDLIIFDEPTTGLDPISRREIWEFIKKLKEENKTIILATHYMEEAEYLCDRVAFIYRKILDVGEISELKQKYKIYSLIKVELKNKIENLPENFSYTKEGYIIYKTLNPETELLNVISTILNLKGEIKTIIIEPAKLEDVFIKIIGEKVCNQ